MGLRESWSPGIGVGFVLAFQTAIVASAQTAPVLAPFAAAEIGVSAENVGYFTAIVFGAALISSNGVAGLMARCGSFLGAAMALAAAAMGAMCLALADTVWFVLLGALLIGLGYGPVNPVGSRVLMRVASQRRRNLIFSIKQSSVSIGGAAAAAALPAIALGFGWRTAIVATSIFTLAIATLAYPVRAILGDDAERGASTRFAGPIRAGRVVLVDPAMRRMAVAGFTFSMMQFGLMSIYVTLLWIWLDLPPETAAAMLSVTLAASMVGRIYWGWRADASDPPKILILLAWSGALLLFAMLFMTPDWPLAATILFSLALGFGPMSWSGVLLSEVASIGAARNGPEGTLRATSGIMVFAYLGGLLGAAMLSVSAAMFSSYSVGIAIMATLLAVAGLALVPSVRRCKDDVSDET